MANDNNLCIYSHIETIRQPLLKHEFGNDEETVVDFFEGGTGSFDKKIGKDKPGREKIKQLFKQYREKRERFFSVPRLQSKVGCRPAVKILNKYWDEEALLAETERLEPHLISS